MVSVASRNVLKFYAVTALTNLWFITGNWLYFYRLYMSDRQIGVLDGVVFALGLLAEIPSGALSDLLGRKRQLQIGLLIMAGGFLMQGFAQAYWYILVGMIMFTVGMALVSGSDDALVYDSLDSEGKASSWKKIIARKFQIIHGVTLASILIGGVLYILNFRLPYILGGVGILIAFLVASTFKEVHHKAEALSMRMYIKQNTEGMRYLFRRHMWLYALMGLVILGVGYVFDLGVAKPLVLDMFGYKANAQAIINALAGVTIIVVLSQLDKFRAFFGEKRGLLGLALLMGVSFLVSSFPVGKIGLIFFLLIVVINSLAEPWLNDIVQQEVPSSHRATALSSLAMLQKLPYILLAPLAGALSTDGRLSLFLLGIAVAILAVVMLVVLVKLLQKRRSSAAIR